MALVLFQQVCLLGLFQDIQVSHLILVWELIRLQVYINFILVPMLERLFGANFVAMADGTVIKAAYNNAYGNMVMIDHGNGIVTLYAHGSEILVKTNQVVKQGQAILKVRLNWLFNRTSCTFWSSHKWWFCKSRGLFWVKEELKNGINLYR